MARSKHRQKAAVSTTRPGVKAAVSEAAGSGQVTFRDYVILNIGFSAFCILQLLLVRLLMPGFGGLYFFFIFLIISFLIVSLFDYFATRMGIGDQLEDSSEPINE